MQELEKILEEIEQVKREPWYRLNNYDVKHKLDGAINRIADIIRKHINDGWIPVKDLSGCEIKLKPCPFCGCGLRCSCEATTDILQDVDHVFAEQVNIKTQGVRQKHGTGGKTMRLIDADELMERMRKWVPKDPCGREQTVEEVVATDIAASIYMEIEETPTAFDKGKVIEQIKCDRDEAKEYEQEAAMIAHEIDIEIVEKGGIK